MISIALFNNKGGVGKTTLVYHLAHMLAELGHRCLVADLDPQANLTSMFLSDDELLAIYDNGPERPTILAALKPLDRGLGDIAPATIHQPTAAIGLLAGDLELSLFEDKLSDSWGKCMDNDEAAFRITSSLYRTLHEAGVRLAADFCLIDVGPNFGAINRATLIGADWVVVPMAADLFSLQGLKNLGERLGKWRNDWTKRLAERPSAPLPLPEANMQPLGYVVMQHGIKEGRPVRSYLAWANRIPGVFREHVIKEDLPPAMVPGLETDPYCLALLKHYHSLAPLSMEARKPIFSLKPADGAIGAHMSAVLNAHKDFKGLAEKLVARTAAIAQD
jgi:cellulose biosynthesis protein BcsQ